jgi:hypothetical protein
MEIGHKVSKILRIGHSTGKYQNKNTAGKTIKQNIFTRIINLYIDVQVLEKIFNFRYPSSNTTSSKRDCAGRNCIQ